MKMSHGIKGVESCAYCDHVLSDESPGRVFTMDMGKDVLKEVVCNECYPSLIEYPLFPVIKIKEFPNNLNLI